MQQFAIIAGSVSASVTVVLLALLALVYFRQVHTGAEAAKQPPAITYKWRPMKGTLISYRAPVVGHAARNISTQPWRIMSARVASPGRRTTRGSVMTGPLSSTPRLPYHVSEDLIFDCFHRYV